MPRYPYEPVDLKAVLADDDATRPRSRQTELARADGRWGVGPSDIGTCRKAIEYRERPPEGYEPLPEDAVAAHVGSILHNGTATAIRRRRRGRRLRLIEAEVFVPGFDVPGHVDLFEVPIGRVTDWKWVGDYAWEQEIALGVREPDLDQVMLYGLGLEEMGYDVREVCVTYVRRARPKEIEPFVRPYDRERALAAADRLHAVIDALDHGRELPRDRLGPDFDGICRGCPARADCWDLDRAAEAKRTAAGWLLARDDEGVETALAAYDEARELAAPFVSQKEYARNLLEGVPRGRYGRFELDFSRPKAKPPVPDPDVRLAIVEEHLADVVDGKTDALHPDLLPRPTKPAKTATPSIIVRRVRAATLEKEAAAAEAVGDELAAVANGDTTGGDGAAKPDLKLVASDTDVT